VSTNNPLATLEGLDELPPIGTTPTEIGSQGIGGASTSITSGPLDTAAQQLGAGSSSSSSGSPSLPQQAASAIANAGLNFGKSVLGAGSGLFNIGPQAITIVVGLILIAGGIFLFKPVQNVVVSAVKNAKKAAETAAVVA